MASRPARRRLGALVALLALAGCGDLPQPFRGRPGGLAPQLTPPPAYRIAVPAPTAALLTDAGGGTYAVALADALEAAEVPAVAGPPLPLDWRLTIRAEREGQNVVPAYALADADGTVLGETRGAPVPLADWGAGTEAMLKRVAGRDAQAVVTMLTRVDAAGRATNPADLAGRAPPRVRLVPVRGAPGDGNRSLSTRMAEFLGGKGLVVQDQADGAGFAVQGEVHVAQGANGTQRIEIQWIVTRRDGEEMGRAVQLNEVPRGSLDGLWGDVAYVVAEEASQGIRDIIANAGGFGPVPARADAPAPQEAPRPAP
ncbi:hypothetical protein LPC08_09825 [Roseomonas sp. OT10]|uniref:hypothetical protein n=1 Tax=Roseomonas cutis TaxID=2897332 RepID=UPI001E342D4F|nr:hypothetical protein [Roseomonas sp. OT10]UFN50879.1 hypothetical protein LPC08_09825 [Roseomonas sp. OT10]